MRNQDTSPDQLRPKNGLLVLSGYGVRVSVRRGQLEIKDGIAEDRRAGRLSRATCGLKRLVILGHTGYMTLEAHRWLNDVGASLVQLDRDGTVILASGPRGLNDARLRRSQAMAEANGTGMAITRFLVSEKLRKQRQIAGQLSKDSNVPGQIDRLIERLAQAETIVGLRLLEAAAADAFWSCWKDLPLTFNRRDLPAVPNHWLTFGTRLSPITKRARLAANPANALLNYLYSILEAEASIALLTMGLDPGIGVYHADQEARDSLACDVMEPIRPDADALLLDLIQRRTFAAREFFETRTGVCRLVAPLPEAVVESAPHFARLLAPIVEHVAKLLLTGPGQSGRRRLPTLLTELNRSLGRSSDRPRPVSRADLVITQLCLECGANTSPGSRYCPDCREARKPGVFIRAGAASLAELRKRGLSPTHGGQATQKRIAKTSQERRKGWLWDQQATTRPDAGTFKRDILPRLQSISIGKLARATGLSPVYCWQVRQGKYVPHPRHWDVLARVAAAGSPTAADQR